MKRFLLIAAVLPILCAAAFGQAWSGILNPARAIDWSHAGLPATFPDGETTANPWTPPAGRTQSGSTVACANNSTDAATINTALSACSNGHYVQLGATTCSITSNILMWPDGGLGAGNGCDLRGSGPMSTILNFSGASTEFQFGVCCTGVGSGALSATSYAVNTSTLTITGVASATNLIANNMAWIQQCDPGWTGSGVNGGTSEPNCSASGAYADTGGIWPCGVDVPGCTFDINPSGAHTYQRQDVLITNVVNNGGGSYTVTFTPGLYMPNWSSNSNAQMIWQTPANESFGNGVSGLTANFTSTTNEKFDIGNTYAWWVKGVRMIGYPSNPNANIGFSARGLFANNYIFGNTPSSLNTQLSETLLRSSDSDNLILNNIIKQSIPSWADGKNAGDVIAYNYGGDTQTLYYIAVSLNHLPWESFLLSEGNQFPQLHDDDTHGTHAFDCYFRNYASGWDSPYSTLNPWAIELDNFQRFDCMIDNAIGGTKSTAYQGTSSSVGNEYVWPTFDTVAQNSAMRWGNCDVITGTCRFVNGEVPSTLDAYTAGPPITLSGTGSGPYTGTIVTGLATLTLGNEHIVASPGDAMDDSQSGALVSQCTGGSNDLTHCSNNSACTGGGHCGITAGSVNPATGAVTVTYNSTPSSAPILNYLYDSGSASPYQNAIPATHNAPCSFFMSNFATSPCTVLTNGGTGLSWWKVCTNWSAFPTSCSASLATNFPGSGPDVSGGPYVNGHAYDIPAALAHFYLPIDTSLQNSLTIAGQADCTGTGGAASSWSAGIETLCVDMSSIDNGSNEHIQGGFQLSGVNAACVPSGINFANTYGNNEALIVVSTRRTTRTEVQYALTSNPGVSCAGTMKFPDVRQFDERVFQTDSGSTTPPIAPSRNIFLGGGGN